MFIRPATLQDAAAIAKVHVDSWRSTYQGIVPDEYLKSLNYEERTVRWERVLGLVKIVIVAENDAGQIVGFANGGAERSQHPDYYGELYALYTLQDYHGRGLGKKLVRAVMDSLSEQGYTSMLLWVLADNPAKGFYEALGGREVLRKEIEISGVKLQEIAYGWREI
jgi:ribosomal protein S18 acetylase RimI-like enzyme